jgi:hypothetical protein
LARNTTAPSRTTTTTSEAVTKAVAVAFPAAAFVARFPTFLDSLFVWYWLAKGAVFNLVKAEVGKPVEGVEEGARASRGLDWESRGSRGCYCLKPLFLRFLSTKK